MLQSHRAAMIRLSIAAGTETDVTTDTDRNRLTRVGIEPFTVELGPVLRAQVDHVAAVAALADEPKPVRVAAVAVPLLLNDRGDRFKRGQIVDRMPARILRPVRITERSHRSSSVSQPITRSTRRYSRGCCSGTVRAPASPACCCSCASC